MERGNLLGQLLIICISMTQLTMIASAESIDMPTFVKRY
jgi:hypothetical protein